MKHGFDLVAAYRKNTSFSLLNKPFYNNPKASGSEIGCLCLRLIDSSLSKKGWNFMQKKHLYFTISIALLSVLHWLFSYFYIRLYGYFNLQGSLNQFLLFTQVFRFVLNFYIIFCGYVTLREENRKLLLIYLLFFLFNLLLPFLFPI